MKILVSILLLAATALARPDVSHLSGGYQYRPPATSYGVPINSVENQHVGTHHSHHTVPTTSYLPSGLQTPSVHSHTDFLSGHGSSGNEGLYNAHSVQDHKHVYYFSSDETEEQQRLRINVVPSHQRNTNVIFVKAPSYPVPIPEVVIPPTHIEDKTKVVVLLKKPEKPDPITIPAPPPVKAAKPEVFVVKYENQYEAEKAVSGGSDGNPIGTSLHHLHDHPTFVKTFEGGLIPHNDKYSGFDGKVNVFGARYGSDHGNLGTSQGSGYTVQTGYRSGGEHLNLANVHGNEGVLGTFELRGGTGGGSSQQSFGFEGGSKGGLLELHGANPVKSSVLKQTYEIHSGNGGLVSSTGSQGTDAILASLGVVGGEDKYKDSFGGTVHVSGSSGNEKGAVLTTVQISGDGSGSGFSSSLDSTKRVQESVPNIDVISGPSLSSTTI